MASTAFIPTRGRPKDQESLLEQKVRLMEIELDQMQGLLDRAYRKIARLEGNEPQLGLDDLLADLKRLEALRKEREREQIEEDREKAQAEIEQEKRREKQRGHGPRPQLALPVIEEIYELEPDTICPSCGLLPPDALGEQFEESEDIHVLERRWVKRKIRRRKGRCTCQGAVVTAPGPKRIIPGGRYSLEFVVQVVIDKWLDHIPLERQTRIMDRQGLEVASQTLYDQAEALARLLEPIYHELGRRVLLGTVLHADETRWPLLDAKKSTPWTVWTRTTPDIAHYAILPSKSKKAAEQLFRDYEGVIVVDGYQVYESLARDGPKLKLANCWAHVLRKFGDIRDDFPKECARIVELITDLYRVEAEIEGPFPGDAEAQSRRLALRREKSAPILADIEHWAQVTVGLPRSALGKAVRYLLKRWKALGRFVENPRIPLDNNAAERALRGPVIGRKVHYGSKSKRGTEVAAVFYTLLETAKLRGVNPEAYLKAATLKMLESGEVLLPEDFQSAI